MAALQQAQGVIEGMAEAIMPIKSGDIDPLRDSLAEFEGDGTV